MWNSIARSAKGLPFIGENPSSDQVLRAPFSVPASDAETDVMAFIEERAGSNYHPTSACAIGCEVDATLRVFDMEGLRIVDATVMP
jgi:choline dehydrogenase